MISEKSDSTQEITGSNDGLKWSEDETIDTDDDNDDDVENDDINDDEYDDDSQRSNNDNTNITVLKVVKVISTFLFFKRSENLK